jgi:hypothetical protein
MVGFRLDVWETVIGFLMPKSVRNRIVRAPGEAEPRLRSPSIGEGNASPNLPRDQDGPKETIVQGPERLRAETSPNWYYEKEITPLRRGKVVRFENISRRRQVAACRLGGIGHFSAHSSRDVHGHHVARELRYSWGPFVIRVEDSKYQAGAIWRRRVMLPRG